MVAHVWCLLCVLVQGLGETVKTAWLGKEEASSLVNFKMNYFSQ